jgi:C_GCAxxG_C_C family probable redox protein
MSENATKAEAMFASGYNCAQSVLVCCGAGMGVSRDAAIRLGAPFGGGMGAKGEVCGAVSGALMALGLKYAKDAPQDPAAKHRVYQLASRFLDAFKKRHGSVLCRDLLGCDISTPELQAKARDAGIFKKVCPPLVRSAAEIADEMLREPGA